MSEDAHWIVKGDVGIRIFPRCGSTTLLRTFSYNQSKEKWLACKKRYIVVRNPVDRLLSAWAMFWPPQDMHMERRGYPRCATLDDLMVFLFSVPQEKMDLHIRSMHSQLDGIPTECCIVVSLPYILAKPPTEVSLKASSMHFRKTTVRPSSKCSAGNFLYFRHLYREDFALWERAKKLPSEKTKND